MDNKAVWAWLMLFWFIDPELRVTVVIPEVSNKIGMGVRGRIDRQRRKIQIIF